MKKYLSLFVIIMVAVTALVLCSCTGNTERSWSANDSTSMVEAIDTIMPEVVQEEPEVVIPEELDDFVVTSQGGYGAYVRKHPSTDSEKLKTYRDGTSFTGAYTDVPHWIMIVEDGHIVGYIHDENVNPEYDDYEGDDDEYNEQQTTQDSYDEKPYVDLALPSGTLWATKNVGAKRPEDYGGYYAWGETRSKKNYEYYIFQTYKWCEGTWDRLTKYCTHQWHGSIVDKKTVLDLEDDAAYVNWGASWRMPSLEQLNELGAECTWKWATRNGVNGYLVTSKRNNESLFLPAAGYRFGVGVGNAGVEGGYWSRSLYTTEPWNANLFFFNYYKVCCANSSRECGRSVRAVYVSHY